MSVRVISFDAAHTLLDVHWRPGRFAVESAHLYGLEVDPQTAMELYDRLVQTRWPDYVLLNQTGDRDQGDRFWDELTGDWLERVGRDRGIAADLSAFARKRMYQPESGCFIPYPETQAAVAALKAAGYTLVVVSNWDYSLERTLEAFGLRELFDHVFASLECGVEKPDVELFRIVEQSVGAAPHEFLHVGDNPIDDYQGARDAGWRAALLDRSIAQSARPRIPDLHAVKEALGWND
jgi:putative hydrolase of the HAD superfamily